MPAVPRRRNPELMLLQAGQLLSTAGTQSAAIVYPLLVLAVTHSPGEGGTRGVRAAPPLCRLPLVRRRRGRG
jgi:hypothetical protein